MVCATEKPGEAGCNTAHAAVWFPLKVKRLSGCVTCRLAVTARLANATKNGAGYYIGRMELLHNAAWVPACLSGFSKEAATVICMQVSC